MPEQPLFASRVFRRTYAYGGGGNPWQAYASNMRAVYLIIGLNTAMFGAWQYARSQRDRKLLQQLYNNATLSWENIRAGRHWTLITNAFSHINLVHFAFNMFSFYNFGMIMSMVPGVTAVHILALSIGSAIAGSLSWLWYPNQSAKPSYGFISQPVQQALGASGMVMGVAATAACLRPLTPMVVMFVVPMPLFAVTFLYAAIDICKHTDL